MDRLKFKNTIQKIPPQKWEHDLEIGNFTSIKTGKILKRPFSYIAKCCVKGTNSSKEVYIKIYRNHNNIGDKALQEQVVTDFNNTRHWYTLFADSKQFHVVKPVMIMPELFLMVTEAIDGDSLGNIIKKKALFYKRSKIEKELKQCCYNTGKWLKFKNEKLTDYKKKYSIDELLEYLDIRLNILTNERQIIPTNIRQHILKYIQNNKKNIPENELLISASHRDFNAGNIIIQNQNVYVIDCGKFLKDSCWLDVSKLFSRIFLFSYKPYYNTSVIKRLQKALLTGFGVPDADRLLIFKFLIIRNIITHLTNISRFRQQNNIERLYNSYVIKKEVSLLNQFI